MASLPLGRAFKNLSVSSSISVVLPAPPGPVMPIVRGEGRPAAAPVWRGVGGKEEGAAPTSAAVSNRERLRSVSFPDHLAEEAGEPGRRYLPVTNSTIFSRG